MVEINNQKLKNYGKPFFLLLQKQELTIMEN